MEAQKSLAPKFKAAAGISAAMALFTTPCHERNQQSRDFSGIARGACHWATSQVWATIPRPQNFVIEGQRRQTLLSPISKWQSLDSESGSATGYKYLSNRIAQLVRP